MQCDGCDKWHHTSCINMPASEYLSLSESDVSWFCPACVSDELPFANCSASDLSLDEENLITESSHPSLFNISQSSSPLSSCTNKAVFCHLNIQCLRNKIDELRSTLTGAKRPVIFGISESWLENDIPDGEVTIPSYNLYRRDRRSSGGVLVYVPERCGSKRRLDLEDDEIECVWVELRLNKRTILLGNMYRLPNAHSNLLANFEAMMERVAAEWQGYGPDG